MVAMALTVFNGCRKDEPVPQVADEQLQDAVKPDVYVEDDYLVFKDFEAFDSLTYLLNSSSIEFIKNFEKSLGFKSAFSYRQEIMEKLEKMTPTETSSFLKSLINEGYFDLQSQEFTYPFYNETRAVVMNPNGKFKIGKTYYKFEGYVQTVSPELNGVTVNDDLENFTKEINHNAFASQLKSATILFNNTTAGGQQRLTMRVLRENIAVYDWIIYKGEIVWGIIGYYWNVSLRFHSWRQRSLSKSDENIYFHYIKRHNVIGGNQIITNEGSTNLYYPFVNENPSNPFTETSPWKAIYYLPLYETGLNPGINSPTIYNIDFDCWSDRLTTPINYVDYSD